MAQGPLRTESETFLLLRRVAYATRRKKHLCLFLRQREAEESVSPWYAGHRRSEPFDPTAPADRHGYVLPSVDAVGRWAAVVAAPALELPQLLPGLRIECHELPRR